MSEIKALEDLYGWCACVGAEPCSECAKQIRRMANEVEEEVDARFMLLPTDAHDEPIHVNDKVYQGGDFIGVVRGVGKRLGEPCAWVCREGEHVSVCYSACGISHRRKPTVEDVLREFAENIDAFDSNYIDAYAERVREAVRDER